MHRLIAGLIISLLPIAAGVACAQDYPKGPVTVIVPIGAGGDADTIGRVLANELSNILGKPFVVENRAGGGSIIGAQAVINSAPDGQMLLLATSSLFVAQAIANRPDVNLREKLVGVASVGRAPWVLVTSASKGIKTVKQFLADVGKAPGKYSYSSGGSGTLSHLAWESLRRAASLEIVHVPYRGGGDANAAVFNNEVDFTLSGTSFPLSAPEQIQPLAVASAKRSDLLPDVPTFKEAGLDYESYAWMGLAAPTGTPEKVLDALNAAVNAALKAPQFGKRIRNVGYTLDPRSRAEVQSFMDGQYKSYETTAKAAGLGTAK